VNWVRWLTIVVAALALLASTLAPAGAASAAKRQVPFGWMGVMADGSLYEPSLRDFDGEFERMALSGVESVRTTFNWRSAQPYRTFDDIPPAERDDRWRSVGGVPTDFRRTDRLMAAAAAHGIRVLPVVITAPDWAARHPGHGNSPPAGTGPYARFVAALARRYGPRGGYWAEHREVPRRPVRRWQFWNEPDQSQYFWSDQPYARDYVALIRQARASLKKVDPDAKVVLAGLTGFSWGQLKAIYRQRGARSAFDEVAIHPYTAKPSGVIEIIRRVRETMARANDSKTPVAVTETTWTSAEGKGTWTKRYTWDTTESGQADRLRVLFKLLALRRRELRISSVYWYSWITREDGATNSFDFSGLRRFEPSGEVEAKPAYWEFRRSAVRLEGCRKTSKATSCR
jgi:polysaccharide biosynthesis protein PslG